MYHKIGFNILLIMGLTALQASFVPSLPGYFSAIDLVLLFIVFRLSLSSFSPTLWLSIFFGFFLDVLSFQIFGYYTFLIPTTTLIGYLLFTYVFTNRSLYSMIALTTFLFLVKELLSILIFYFFKLTPFVLTVTNVWSRELVGYKLIGLLLDLGLVIILFNIINFFSHRLKPVFVMRGSK